MGADVFNKDELQNYISTHQFPEKVMNDLKILAFTEKVGTKEVIYAGYISSQECVYEDIVGYAIKDGNRIFFSYIRSKTKGYIPNRIVIVPEEKCIHILLWKWCYDLPSNRAVPFTDQEIKIVENALKYINYEAMEKKIQTIVESQTLLGSDGKILSSNNYLWKCC